MIRVCRLCVTLNDEAFMLKMNTNTHEMCLMLHEVLHVKVDVGDGNSNCICLDCASIVQNFYAYYLKVQSNQKTLQKLLDEAAKKVLTHETVLESAATDSALLKQALQLQQNETRTPEQEPEELLDTEENYKQQQDQQQEEELELLQTDEQYALDDDMNEITFVIENKPNAAVHRYELRPSRHEKYKHENSPIAISIVSEDEHDMQEQHVTADEVSADDDDMQFIAPNEQIDIETASFNIFNDSNDDDENDEEEHIEQQTQIDDIDHINIDITEWKHYVWPCADCDLALATRSLLQQHMKTQHLVRNAQDVQYKCFHCLKKFKRYHAFLNHVRFMHCKGLLLNCDECDQCFDSFDALKVHRRNCEQISIALEICEICGKSFINTTSLQIHKRSVHDNSNGPYLQCDICQKHFKSVSTLRAHKNLHAEKKTFVCNVCNRAFHTKAYLKNHLLSHTEEKQFTCLICEKEFKTLPNLEKHCLTHTEQPKYKCDHCPNIFRTKGAKFSHERTHTGEKPYKCEYCDKTFRYRSVLICHRNTHTGNRPYVCNVCERTFTNWPNWNKHMKRAHKTIAAATAADEDDDNDYVVTKKVQTQIKRTNKNSKLKWPTRRKNDAVHMLIKDENECIRFERCFDE